MPKQEPVRQLSLMEDEADEQFGFNFARSIDSIEDLDKKVEDVEDNTDTTDVDKKKTDKPKDVGVSTIADPAADDEDDEDPELDVDHMPDPDEPKASDEDSSILKNLFTALSEKGVIEFKPEEFKDEDEYILGLFENKIKSGIDEYKSKLPEKFQDMLDAYEKGVPISSFLEYEATVEDYDHVIKTLEGLDDDKITDDKDTQRNLVREMLSGKGFAADKIEARIKRFEDSGILEDEAKDAKLSLIELRKIEKDDLVKKDKQQRAYNEKRYTDYVSNLKTVIEKKEEIIPGFKMSADHKKKLYDGITKFDRDNKNELIRKKESDPDFDLKVAYLALVLNWDFDAFEKKAGTKMAKSMRDSILNEEKSGGVPASKKGKFASTDSGKPDIKLMEKILNKTKNKW